MAAKQALGQIAPDGSQYVVLTDGAGNLGTTITAVSSDNLAQVGGNTVAVGVGASSTGTQRVVLARAGTGTKSNVPSSASSVTILASNANRQGMTVYNDSTQILYLDLSGGTASNSSYSVQLAANAFYVLDPPYYTGAITGIWASANGNARVTEWT